MSPFRFAAARDPLVIAILLLGIAERVIWNLLRPDFGAGGEAMNVALAIADGRGIADAYRIGQGPTAHLLPISPAIAGGVYYLFGIGSRLSEFLLATWSIGLAIGTYLFLYRAFGHLGLPLALRRAGLAIGCLAPTYISQEAVDFRVWEGGLATFLTAVFLERLLALRNGRVRPDERQWRAPARLGFTAGLLFFVNPLLGASAIGSLASLSLRRLDRRQIGVAAGVGGIVMAATVLPWTLRNSALLGAPIPLRSNAGLELSLTNYPKAASTTDERGEFVRRLNAVHPTMSEPAFRAMMATGEVAYFEAMGSAALDWIRAHPGDAAWLWLHHMRETIFPSGWKFDVSGTSRTGWLKALLAQAVGIFGLVGIAAMLVRRPGRGAAYPAIVVLLLTVVLSPFQPVVRYTYLIYPIMVFFAAAAPLLLRRSVSSH